MAGGGKVVHNILAQDLARVPRAGYFSSKKSVLSKGITTEVMMFME